MLGRVPAAVRAIAGAERVLAHARTPAGDPVVATRRALHLPADVWPGPVAWDEVLQAAWRPPHLLVTLHPQPGRPERQIRVELAWPGALPEVLRERVAASIVGDVHVPLSDDGGGVRLLARRTGTGEVRWSVLFDAGLDPADPTLREAADAALAELRRSWGV